MYYKNKLITKNFKKRSSKQRRSREKLHRGGDEIFIELTRHKNVILKSFLDQIYI